MTLAIEVTNRLSDRVEDVINRPERTELCAHVGWHRLARLQALLWSAVVAAAAVWLALEPGVLLALLIGMGIFAGIGYSRGPRLSRRRLLVFVILSGTFVGPFLLGWVAGSPGAGLSDVRLLGHFVPLLWVVTLFITSLAGIKDITDRAGDESVGYRSAFLQLAERHGSTALVLVAAAPYAALAAFVAVAALPTRMLALEGLLPISIALAFAVRSAGASASDRLAVREAFYLHWLAFTSVALLASFPSGSLLAALTAGWLSWMLASRYVHWSEPLRLVDLPRLARLVAQPSPATEERPAWAIG